MSAYGALLKSSQSPKGVLAPTVWKVDNVSRRKTEGSESEQQGQIQEGKKTGEIMMFHLTLETAPGDLVGYMSDEFLEELARGRTYPQELMIKTEEGEEKQVYGRKEFEGYFFAGDVLVGLLVDSEECVIDSSSEGGKEGKEVDPTQVTLEGVRRGREWKECVTGFYYVSQGNVLGVGSFFLALFPFYLPFVWSFCISIGSICLGIYVWVYLCVLVIYMCVCRVRYMWARREMIGLYCPSIHLPFCLSIFTTQFLTT